jgi:polyhydroxybutyrate depolymerase
MNRSFFYSLTYLVLAALLAACSRSYSDPEKTLQVNGVLRGYLLHVPLRSVAERVPLVLVFHGLGGTGSTVMKLTGLDQEADKNGFFVVYPNGLNHGWNDGREVAFKSDDIGFVSSLIDSLENQYLIDPNRVYATGVSNGGMFCFRLACELSGKIVAIAPVAANMPSAIVEKCHPELPVSVAMFSGTADPLMPFGGGMIGRFGRGGFVVSAAATYLRWRELDRCENGGESVTLPERSPPDGTRVQAQEAVRGQSATAVTLFTIVNGGHAWPGGPQYLPEKVIGKASNQIVASEVIVAFFLSHPRPSR